MADLDLSAWVTRVQLGQGSLVLAPSDRYYLAPQFLGGTVTWNRQQATSPFVDGQFTFGRTRPNVTETVAIEITADTVLEMQAYTTELVQAFCQDTFTMHVSVDGAVFEYECEAADYQVLWTTPRFVAAQGQAIFQVPRRPAAVVGGY